MGKQFKWYIHTDMYDNDKNYIRREFKKQIGRYPTDEEIDILATAVYEFGVLIDIETGKLTLVKE